jgi:hypothetical protein
MAVVPTHKLVDHIRAIPVLSVRYFIQALHNPLRERNGDRDRFLVAITHACTFHLQPYYALYRLVSRLNMEYFCIILLGFA